MATAVLPRTSALALGKIRLHPEALGVFISVMAGLYQLRPAIDPDLGWHLRDGQVILATHTIPRVDAYSHTFAGVPWADFEWLWESALAAIYGAGGMVTAVAINSVLTIAVYGLIYVTLRVRRLTPLMAAFGVIFGAATLRAYDDVRPGMMGALLAAAFLLVLEMARHKGWRWLLLLLPLQILWANSHGSYVEGPVLCGLYGLAAVWDRRSELGANFLAVLRSVAAPWAALCSALLIVSLVNPMGVGLIQFTVGASRLSANQDFNGEWMAPNFHQFWAVPLLLSILASIALPVFSQRARPSRREGLLLIAATLATLHSGQFVPFYAVVAAPILAGMLAAAIGRPIRPALSPLHGLLFGLTLMFPTALAMQQLRPDAYEAALSKHFPVAAVRYIEAHELQGPLWNDFNWGCYLLSALPRLPVFIDGRTEMYGDDFFKEYSDVAWGIVGPNDTLERWGINLILLQPKSPMATLLREGGRWEEVYRDDQAVIFVRPGSQPYDSLDRAVA